MNSVFFSLLAINDDGYIISGTINDGSSTFSFTINETIYEVEVVNGKWRWEIPQDFDATSLQEAFKDKTNLTSINLSKLPTSSCTNASGLFSGCTSLTKAILPKNFGGEVTNMSNMFYNCSSLGTINTAQIDISSCEDISGMFYGCTSIAHLNLLPWNTTSIANYSDFVPNSSSLTIDYYSNRFNPSLVSSFPDVNWNDEYNVIRGHITNGDSMFTFNINNTSTQVDVDEYGNWVYRIPSTITTLTNAFRDKTNLDVLDLTNMDTSSCTSFNSMFQESSIDKISLPQGFGSSCTNMDNMFLEFTSSKLDLTNLDTSSCTSMYQMFYGCNIESIIFPQNFGSSCTNMNDMFNSSLMTKIDLSNFSTTTSATMNQMFRHCEDLVEVTFPQNFASNVTNMSGMFSYCTSLKSIDLSNIDVSNVTSLESMFYYCNSLKYINLSSWNTQNVGRYEDFVPNVSTLTIDYDSTIWNMAIKRAYNQVKWNDVHHYNITGKVNDSSSTFSFKINDTQIQVSVNGQGNFYYDIPQNTIITSFANAFSSKRNLTSLKFYDVDTSQCTDMNNMFYESGSSDGLELDVSCFDTSNVENMNSMFENCYVENLDLLNFDTSSCLKMSYMFRSCRSVSKRNIKLPDNFGSKATSMLYMFQNCSMYYFDVPKNFGNSSTNVVGMFSTCSRLQNIDLSSFITPLQYISNMFANCSQLKYINARNVNTLNVSTWTSFIPDNSTLTIDYDSTIWNPDIVAAFPNVHWNDISQS